MRAVPYRSLYSSKYVNESGVVSAIIATMESIDKKRRPTIEGTLIARKVERGIEQTRWRLDAGDYVADIGFRQFGKFESDWFSGANNSEEMRQRPLVLDHQNQDVQRFAEKLLSGDVYPDSHDFIHHIDERLSRLLPSADLSEYEHYERLSDIVNAGRAMCDAKCTVLGTLLVHEIPSLKAQMIYGQIAPIRERASYPFGHAWLRVESNSYVSLYDAMYSRTTVFEKSGRDFTSLDDGYMTFQKYGAQFGQFGKLMSELGISAWTGNITFVEDYENDRSVTPYVAQEESLDAQVAGSVSFGFRIDEPAELELFNDHLRATKRAGAALYYPVQRIKRNF